MTLTDVQLAKLAQLRKRNPPSFYNTQTGASEQIDADTESALILAGSEVKQKAAKYLDLLLDANPSKDDADKIIARATTKQIANLTSSLAELEPVVTDFDAFKDNLIGSGKTDELFARGMNPLLQSLLRGFSKIKNRIDGARFTKKVQMFATAKYSSKITDDQRKEWRSWKRVLLSYP